MAKYNFDEIIDRGPESGSWSSKWQGFETSFPGYDVSNAIPMWVADMDFACPPEVTAAVVKRAQHGIYGYASGQSVDAFKQAASGWLQRRHGWEAHPEDMIFVPAIVPAINAAIQACTEPGDGVIIQTPVYYPFVNSIRNNGRTILENKLVEQDGRYTMDLEGLEKLASDPKAKMLLLCSPHNPVCRVWTRKELEQVAAICRKWDLLLFSDEIHGDLVMEGYQNTSVGCLMGREDQVVIAYSPSKTFNIAGLQAGLMIVPNRELHDRIQAQTVANRLPFNNVFGPIAGEAAFRTGDAYVDELCAYLTENYRLAEEFCRTKLKGVRLSPPEGTYLAWFDFRGTGLPEEEVNRMVLEEAGVAGDLGSWFGETGKGFIRINLACPRSRLQEALERLAAAGRNHGITPN